ncbi:RIP metalloprotease RseP [Luteibacter anthropi]|uniref:RIP metalloprotease RseP n=1 Tax=Luteibacter anthropi TaxID=564369 RepID=UPI002032BB6C|nr:RIP metalloprotease RseP [Luteibacter anthropi]URX60882.1 RIP metalloprotease RseP [Luteibacter anthropi]
MSPVLGSVFWLLVTLGVLVTFHEFGHYWVARRCGVRVLRFSVGFGRPLWRRVAKDGTEYQIAAIPLGGYVKMLDAREGDVDPSQLGEEFTAKPVWQRIAIVAAGPAFNLIFTIAAFWAMYIVGKPDVAPLVTAAPTTIAAQAGIRPGDRIVAMDGEPVSTWSDAMNVLANALLGTSPLPVRVTGTDGAQRDVVLPLQKLDNSGDIGQRFVQLGLAMAPMPPVIGSVLKGAPASLAGLRANDRIVSVNGQPVTTFEAFSKLVSEQAKVSPQLALVIERDGKPMNISLTARMASEQGQPARWQIGVAALPPEAATLRYGPVRAFTESLSATWNGARNTVGLIGKMLSGEASTKNLSGVIGIAQVANDSANRGLGWFLNFLALVSLSLAILNLLPIPVLDGGHLLYYLIELVKGSPVSERTMIAGQYVGLALLFTLMGLAFFNDIQRMLVS